MANSQPIAAVEERTGRYEAHGAAVRAMFDRIAPTYDLLNRLLSAGLDVRWRNKAVAELADMPAGEVLDVCAGTLDLSAAIERAYPERDVVAVDFAADMLERGKHKVSRTSVVVGDAMSLPFDNARFAGAICGFGLRNLGNPGQGIAEARRVLKPGGRLVILEFFKPTASVTRAFHAGFARMLPAVGRVVSRDADAYRYLAKSMASFVTREECEDLLRAHGFRDVRSEELTFGVASIVTGVL
jgi:ubiquinone/menaquinone biosynthesis methyltransferase